MNVGDEQSRSCWMGETVAEAPPLAADAECDVVVIGSGIAGLSTAYELARFDRRVIVIDRGRIGRGMTARTTAHLATELDDYYHELIDLHGEDTARLYHDSQVSAVNRIEAICRDEGIEADFARVDGYLFAAEESHRADLETEYRACRAIGMPVEWASRAPIPDFDTGPALRFADQGRIHPLKYLAGLARAIEARGGRLHAETAYISSREVDGGVEVVTEAGPVIRAAAAVFCTNSPTNDKVAVHSKQVPNRTYVIAGRIPSASVADALLWDSYEAYHYVRIHPLGDGSDLLIVGGEDHRSGEENDMEARFARLEQWARQRYPSLGPLDYRWSGQVLEPVDFMPFSGLNPGNRAVYIHTGDSGQGITNGVAGSLTILPLIIGEDSRYAPILDPDRKAASAVGEFLKGQAAAVRNFAEYLAPGEASSADALAPGEGAVIREGTHKFAVYRSPEGALVRRSAACTHLGCLVHWNPFEKCWDCPCHGSQFAPEGKVLNGPAVKPLAPAEG
ncbi:FAD-dependent oxidoreductase [Allosphingosinicella humi]